MPSPRSALHVLAAVLGAGLLTASSAAAAARPDLTVSHVSFDGSSVTAGDLLAVHDTTTLKHGSHVGATATAYYLSTDGRLGKGDVRLGSRTVGALGAGHSSRGTAHVRVPKNARAGSFKLLACADYRHRVRETREVNNCGSSHRRVKVRAAAPPRYAVTYKAKGGYKLAARHEYTEVQGYPPQYLQEDQTSAFGWTTVFQPASIGAQPSQATGADTWTGVDYERAQSDMDPSNPPTDRQCSSTAPPRELEGNRPTAEFTPLPGGKVRVHVQSSSVAAYPGSCNTGDTADLYPVDSTYGPGSSGLDSQFDISRSKLSAPSVTVNVASDPAQRDVDCHNPDYNLTTCRSQLDWSGTVTIKKIG